jgi:Fe2+ transport system protein FeoA
MVVKVVRRAPLGDPIALSFGGIEICLRDIEARDILIDIAADCPVPRPQKKL